MNEPRHSDALRGCRVAITRPAHAADEFADLLASHGGVPVRIPLIALELAPAGPLLDALAGLASYQWVVFTSANAVRAVAAAQHTGQMGPVAPPRRTAAVGPATAAAVAELLHWPVDVVPADYTGAAITAALAVVAPLQGARVLWPRAEAARDELPRDLAEAGATVDDPVCYRTVLLPEAAGRLGHMIDQGAVDVVTFTSPSAVNAFAAAVTDYGRATFAVIGPASAAAARQNGLPVHVEPEQHTIAALVQALCDHIAADTSRGGERG